ncbi:putative conjugative transfer protein TraH [Orientia tsutsugamushi str. TA716]|nr:putative conjugative transfer protein TraH [Orientia tsutsugamushi str. TA716]
MREAVCRDIQSQSGFDYFAAGKKCRNDLAKNKLCDKHKIRIQS